MNERWGCLEQGQWGMRVKEKLRFLCERQVEGAPLLQLGDWCAGEEGRCTGVGGGTVSGKAHGATWGNRCQC